MRAATPFHVLAKPTGSACNLACEYCFFLEKSALYPNVRQRMSDEVLEAYLRQLFDAQPDGPVAVAWQGGEPTLMGLPFFERAVRLAEGHRRPNLQIEYTLQTNATLLDDDWAAFLAENKVLVGVSIDGPEDVHDAYRRDRDGRGTHALVLAGIEKLEAHGVEWNALTAVHARSEGRGAEVYRYLRDEAVARFIQFIPIVERAMDDGVPTGAEATDRSVSASGYGTFMSDVFDEWVRHDVANVFVQAFDDALAAYVGEPRICIHAPTCGRAVALEFNGDVYSCDHFVEPDARLGNILETPLAELVESEQQTQFGQRKAASIPGECQECAVGAVCAGGCPKDRFVTGGQPDEVGRNYLCAGYRDFFSHINAPMRIMAGLLSAGRPPSEIMRLKWRVTP